MEPTIPPRGKLPVPASITTAQTKGKPMAQTQNPPADVEESATEETPETGETPAVEATAETAAPVDYASWDAVTDTSELQLRKPRNLDMDAANALLAKVTAKGYNDDGISVASVGNGIAYPTQEAAETAANPAKNLLQRVAPEGKNAGVAYVNTPANGETPASCKFFLYLKPKGEPRAAKTAK